MKAVLALDDIGVTRGGRALVSGASLCVERGEIAALIGPNGAGKSTLMRVAIGALAPSAGRAMLSGEAAAALSPAARARLAAYLPQAPECAWPISVEALVALGRFSFGAGPDKLAPADRAAIDAALAAVNLAPLRARSIDSLSGGERARAHLARAMAQGAPLLALDEPTAELDPAHALAALDAIRAHAHAGGGVLFTTHDIAFAVRAATTIHVMAEGRIIASGAPMETLTEDVLRAAYGRRGRVQMIDGAPAVAFF